MENETPTQRGLIIILVVATVAIFVGLVWLIASLHPWEALRSLDSTPTSAGLVIRNCTYSLTYWRQHPELYPPRMIIGGTIYSEREIEALLTADNQDPAQQIKVQLALAFLNAQSGADQSSIEATIFDAYGWLVQHPPGSPVPDQELAAGRQYYDILEEYNLGLGDVAPCEVYSAVIRTVTPTLTSTGEAAQTASATASGTPTGTLPSTVIEPSITSLPTTARPGAPSSTPTRTSLPIPSHTPTTQAPTPTRTPAPTFTHTPLPTSTNTPLPSPTFTPPPTPTATPTQPTPPPAFNNSPYPDVR